MGISAPGVGTGLDINSIINQLMSLEKRPLGALEQTKSRHNAQLSAYGTLKSNVAAFQTAAAAIKNTSSFSLFKATSSDTAILSASAGSEAVAGPHAITVTQLARSQKLASAPFADFDTTALGTGTITLSNGTSSFSLAIDGTNNTLDGIKTAINSASDNFGVSASILNDGTGFRLVVSPTDTGTSKAITLSVDDTGDGNSTDNAGLSRFSYTPGANNLTQTQTPLDAVMTVDGITGITKPSNTVTDVIQGVTLNLKAVGTTNLNVERDKEELTKKVQAFVDAYNTLAGSIADLRKKGGTLEADSAALSVENQLRAVFNTPASISGTNYKYLAEVGLSFGSGGKLSLNATELDAAMGSRFNDVVKLFTHDTEGFAQRLHARASEMLQTDGLIESRRDGINKNIRLVETRIEQMNVRLQSTERRLRAQFSALDSLLGSLQQTSNFLTNQLRR